MGLFAFNRMREKQGRRDINVAKPEERPSKVEPVKAELKKDDPKPVKPKVRKPDPVVEPQVEEIKDVKAEDSADED